VIVLSNGKLSTGTMVRSQEMLSKATTARQNVIGLIILNKITLFQIPANQATIII